jgi:WD40 repeat protein
LLAALAALCVVTSLAGAAAAPPRETWDVKKNRGRLAAFSPDGKLLAFLPQKNLQEQGVEVWDVRADKLAFTLKSDQTHGNALAFTPDSGCLVVVGERSPAPAGPWSSRTSANVWDLTTQTVQLTIDFPEGVGKGALVTPDGKTLIVGRSEGPVGKWMEGPAFYDLTTGKETGSVDLDPEFLGVNVMALSPDGKTLALGTQKGAIVLWDMKKGSVRDTISAYEDGLRVAHPLSNRVEILTFSADGKVLASWGGIGNHAADLWDPATAKHLDKLEFRPSVGAVESLAFSPDGKSLAVGGADLYGGVELWDLASFGFRDDFPDDAGHADVVRCVAFSPDGKTVVGVCDKVVKLWDVPAGKPTGTKSHELTPEIIKLIDR